jgi:leader peptidase (prepilin peptidase)/N-methyltransferase
MGVFSLPFLLTIAVVVTAIFITDLEHQLIPDELVFFGFVLSFVIFLIFDMNLFMRLFSAFSAASFYLALNLITLGRGMGLGDVKFALLGGLILPSFLAVAWVMLSFLIGGMVGAVLLLTSSTKMGSKIAFGPFMAISFFVVLIFGYKMLFPI